MVALIGIVLAAALVALAIAGTEAFATILLSGVPMAEGLRRALRS